MHGAAFANWAVNGEYKQRKNPTEPMVKIKDGADLLLAFGVRFDDRVTGKFEEFCKHGTIVHIDIDASELNKNRKAHLPIVGDIKDALDAPQRDDRQAARSRKSTPPGSRKLRNGSRKRRSRTRLPRKSPTATT